MAIAIESGFMAPDIYGPRSPDEHEKTGSAGTVLVSNGVALLAFSPIGRVVGVGRDGSGIRAVLAIHDTGPVVGGWLARGAGALEGRATVHLSRAPWIVPIVVLRGGWTHRGSAGPGAPKPLFNQGFPMVSAIPTWAPAFRPPGEAVARGERQVTARTHLPVGAGTSREALRRVGPRPFVPKVARWPPVSLASPRAVRDGPGNRSEGDSHFKMLVPGTVTG